MIQRIAPYLIAIFGLTAAACASSGTNTTDTAATDTAAIDTAAADTAPSDTKVTDTAVTDTEIADTGAPTDTESPDDSGDVSQGGDPDASYPGFVAEGSNERDIDYGWIAAGQPSQARVEAVVALGAHVISLRTEPEDPFDEPAVVAAAGGEFTRYPVVPSDYETPSFREALYDLYDARIAAGGPVYLHCASSNRVGASWALYMGERKGLDAAEAITLGKAAGMTSLTSMVEGILGVE